MDLKFLPTIMAADQYNCGTYGAGAYNESQCATDTGTGGSTGDGLADTGYDIIVPLAFGLAIIVASVILLVKRLRANRAKT